LKPPASANGALAAQDYNQPPAPMQGCLLILQP